MLKNNFMTLKIILLNSTILNKTFVSSRCIARRPGQCGQCGQCRQCGQRGLSGGVRGDPAAADAAPAAVSALAAAAGSARPRCTPPRCS